MKKQDIPKFQMITEGVIGAVKEGSISVDGRVRVTDMVEVTLIPGGSLNRMLCRQFKQGGTFDYRILVSQSYWLDICNFSAQVSSIGTDENEVTVGLVLMNKPTWERVSKRIWNRRRYAEHAI